MQSQTAWFTKRDLDTAIRQAEVDLRQIKGFAYPLLSLCLRRRGEIVLNRSLGHYRDGEVASVNTPINTIQIKETVSSAFLAPRSC